MRYLLVAEACRDLERVTGRLEMIARLARLLRDTPRSLLGNVVYLCQGKIAPDFTALEIGLGEKLAARAVAQAGRTDVEQVTALVRETGDLGTAAEHALAAAGQSRLPTLEVERVVDGLHEIAAAAGKGAQRRKLSLLVELLASATPLEARYLVRTVIGRLRVGVGDVTILDGLAEAMAGDRSTGPVLERAYNLCSNLGLVAETLAGGGMDAVAGIEVRPGNPVRPMLAQRLSGAEEILRKLGGVCAAEFKYDGVRVQAHLLGRELELFSRRLERISGQFPDAVEILENGLRARQAILEAVAFDPDSGLRPFQELGQRRRRYAIERAVKECPIALFAFDLLYVDGEDLTRLPYSH